MRKHTRKFIFLLFIIGVFVAAFFCYIYIPWIILPTESSPHMLTLAYYGGVPIQQVTLKHYVNDVHINDYLLELKVELRNQLPHKYKLPQLTEGSVEVDMKSSENFHITTIYPTAQDLYDNGLLIYSTQDGSSHITIDGYVCYDQYVYFRSGKNKTCFCEKAGDKEWVSITNYPKPKKIVRKDVGYSPLYYGWKENDWVVLPVDNTFN